MDTPPPFLLDGDWEAPQPNRLRVVGVAVFLGIALLATCVAFLTSSERKWEPNDERAWVPPALLAMSADTALPGKRVKAPPPPPPPLLGRFNLSEPDEVPASAPPRRRSTQHVVRPAGYLFINSSPWAELSVDGQVVGNTPQIRVRVTPGRHHVLLAREGFQTHRVWINVAAGGTVRLTDITLERVTP